MAASIEEAECDEVVGGAEAVGDAGEKLVNRFLDHLVSRGFSQATVRADAFDLPTSLRSSPLEGCALSEFLVTTDGLVENPVPRPRRSSGLRAVRRGMLGHVVRSVRSGPAGGRLVSEPSRLPESSDPDDVGGVPC